MEIIKTIFKLSFFILGCVMLMFSLLVIPVGFKSFIWFFGFSLLFYLLSYQYVLLLLKIIFKKKKNDSNKLAGEKDWIKFNLQNISYNKYLKVFKLNSKIYNYDQIDSIKLIANNKEITTSNLKKLQNIKNLEIKIGAKIKKVTYRHFKYITANTNVKTMKKIKKEAIKDYKKMTSLLK